MLLGLERSSRAPPGRGAGSDRPRSPKWTQGVALQPAPWSFRISVSSSLLDGYDDPEILPYSIPAICLIGADGAHTAARKSMYPTPADSAVIKVGSMASTRGRMTHRIL